jgi:hypothetical protein
MKRVLAGVLAMVVVAIAGFFGFRLYVQHRAASEVETAFEAIRAGGAKASHGPVTFDPWTRKLTIADIKVEGAAPDAQPAQHVSIGTIAVAGLTRSDAARISADSIDINDIDIGAQLPAPAATRLNYKAARLTVKNYDGPDRITTPPAGSPPLDVVRAVLRQLVTINAASITIPRIDGTMESNAAATGSGEFTYAGLVIDNIRSGKIASYRLDEMSFTTTMTGRPQAAVKAAKMSGRIVDIVNTDIDANPLVAALDPDKAQDKARDDRIYPVYGQATAGLYEITSDVGVRMRMEGLKIDEVGLRPSRLQLPALLAAISHAPGPPSPAQTRELLDKVAGLYQAIQLTNGEMRGLSIETPQGPIKLASLRFGLADGKVDFSVEGLDGRTPQGPVRLGRFALKSFDLANLMRLGAQFADRTDRPTASRAAQALEFLKVIEGVELKDFVGPYKASNKQVKIDNITLNWGQFVGPIPTQARLVAKLAGPLDTSNPAALPLLAAGIDTAALDADVGAAWTESSGTFALAPVRIELGNLLSMSAGLSLAHVPRAIFTSDAEQASAAATQVETGTVELTLRDLGVVDLLVAQYARSHNLSRDAARQAIIDGIKAAGEQANANPDAPAAVEAIVRFVETPRQTLTLKLTPRARVPTMQLIDLLRTEPPTALAQFRIEVSTGL